MPLGPPHPHVLVVGAGGPSARRVCSLSRVRVCLGVWMVAVCVEPSADESPSPLPGASPPSPRAVRAGSASQVVPCPLLGATHVG